MRTLLATTATLLLGAAALPTHASAVAVGPYCSFAPDPTDLRSDVAAYVVTGGPVHVTEPGVTSVTISCWLLTDGSRAASVSATRPGAVGYVAGRTSVGTFTGPVITTCTEIRWTGGSGGYVSNCPDVA